MKSFTDLTTEQQDKAVQYCLNLLLSDIVEGGVRFDDTLNNDDLQARIDAAVHKADTMQTPWFYAEYIMDAAKEELTEVAAASAALAMYAESDEFVIPGII